MPPSPITLDRAEYPWLNPDMVLFDGTTPWKVVRFLPLEERFEIRPLRWYERIRLWLGW